MVPIGDHLVAELTPDYAGLLAKTSESKILVVAGAGFSQWLTIRIPHSPTANNLMQLNRSYSLDMHINKL